MTASKIIIDRLVPLRKGRPVAIPLPDIKSADDISKALSVVVGEMASGSISPDEANPIGAVIEGKRKAIEMCEFDAGFERWRSEPNEPAHGEINAPPWAR